jgi:hypothetical protein
MKLTQAEAARAAGVSRTQILRAIKGGKVSAEKLEDGSVRIDGSELLRVWPDADLKRARNSGNTVKQRHGDSHGNSGNSDSNTVGNSNLQAAVTAGDGVSKPLLDEIRASRDRLQTDCDRLRAELDRERSERERLVRVIEEQAAAVRSQGEQIRLLTDQRGRRPWWRRLWGG